MKCENLQFNLPIYLDDILSEDERAVLDAHLVQCPLCRQKLADFQGLRNSLRVLPRPEISQNLLNSVRLAVAGELQEVEAKPERIFSESFLRWLEFRLMPYSVGVAASLIFAFLLLGAMLPGANRNGQSSQMARNESSSVMLTNPKSDFYTFDETQEMLITQEDFARHRISVSGESPSVNPAGALVALTKSLVRGKMKDDEVVVVADVFGDGLAQIAEIVKPPRDEKTLEDLNNAFNSTSTNAPFVPAAFDNRAESVRVVFKIQLVDVKTPKPQTRRK